MKAYWLLLGLVSAMPLHALATRVNATFTPTTTFVSSNSGSSLQVIPTNETTQNTPYNEFTQTFEYVTYRFKIASINAGDATPNYALTLFDSAHTCYEDSPNNGLEEPQIRELEGVIVKLDNSEFELNMPQNYQASSNPDNNAHRMSVHFPKIKKSTVGVSCQGSVAIQVEAIGI